MTESTTDPFHGEKRLSPVKCISMIFGLICMWINNYVLDQRKPVSGLYVMSRD